MKILFLGVACTKEAIKESDIKYNNGKPTIRPQQYFDLNLIKGLSEYADVEAISEPPVGSYPKSKCFYYNRKKDKIAENTSIKYISLLNIFLIKTVIIFITTFISVCKFCLLNSRKDSAIVLGSISFYKWLPTVIISKIFKFKTILIVPDIPKYSNDYSSNNSKPRIVLNQIIKKFNIISEKGFDGFIFLTKDMNCLINKKNMPYIIMEGFINTDDFVIDEDITKNGKKIVMYAGTLHEKFGIRKLVEAFNKVKSKEVELWIYGNGDYSDKLKEICNSNNNIKYKGSKSKEEIVRIEREVNILVNPRPSNEEFTKYSFPSKTLEYMYSGTPLLTTKLAGIPKEYYEYILVFEKEDSESMAMEIENVLSMSNEDLNRLGLKAKNFVKDKKNNIAQANRIYNLISKVLRV